MHLVQQGNIAEAIDAIRAFDPTVRANSHCVHMQILHSLLFPLNQHRFLEMVASGSAVEAMQFARDEIAPLLLDSVRFPSHRLMQ